MPPLGEMLADGEFISFGEHTLRVIHTPGHSPGSVLFYCESEKVLLGEQEARKYFGQFKKLAERID